MSALTQNLGLLEFLLALLTAIVGFGVWLVDRNTSRRAAAAASEAQSLARTKFDQERKLEKQRQDAERKLEKERYDHGLQLLATDQVTSWAKRGAHAMSKVDHILALESSIGNRERIELASEISALIDEGRWLFPNWHREKYGTQKHSLNQGYRDARISPLVRCYERLMNNQGIDPDNHRKTFVRQIQELSLPLADRVSPRPHKEESENE